jgi:hypothetical protein
MLHLHPWASRECWPSVLQETTPRQLTGFTQEKIQPRPIQQAHKAPSTRTQDHAKIGLVCVRVRVCVGVGVGVWVCGCVGVGIVSVWL